MIWPPPKLSESNIPQPSDTIRRRSVGIRRFRGLQKIWACPHSASMIIPRQFVDFARAIDEKPADEPLRAMLGLAYFARRELCRRREDFFSVRSSGYARLDCGLRMGSFAFAQRRFEESRRGSCRIRERKSCRNDESSPDWRSCGLKSAIMPMRSILFIARCSPIPLCGKRTTSLGRRIFDGSTGRKQPRNSRPN